MSASDLHFTAEQEPQVENYRPLCGLAVASLVLGLLSPLAVLGAYLVVLPLAGAVLAIAALGRIHASGGDLSGRRLAVAALVLSCLFASWTLAHDLGRRWILASEARRFCDHWFGLIAEGKFTEAYQWSLEPAERVPPDISLQAFFERNTEASQRREQFLSGLPFSTAVEGESPLRDFRYLGNESVTTRETGDDIIIHRYEVSYEKDGKLQREVCVITACRTPSAESKFVHWNVRELRAESLPVRTY